MGRLSYPKQLDGHKVSGGCRGAAALKLLLPIVLPLPLGPSKPLPHQPAPKVDHLHTKQVTIPTFAFPTRLVADEKQNIFS